MSGWVGACVRACARVHPLHSYARTVVDVYIMCSLFVKLLITFSILIYLMCVTLCLISALSRRVGALQISIIIIIVLVGTGHVYTRNTSWS